ncbi:hypothetical protein E4T56_gene17890 [Termitomyces sp. T112]|nr:hypothetical protein E4T56_gene17890 [Termitomyces sp. T112]
MDRLVLLFFMNASPCITARSSNSSLNQHTMAPNDSSLLHVTSNALSGITSLFYPRIDFLNQDKTKHNNTPLSERSFTLGANNHHVFICLKNASMGHEPEPLFRDFVQPWLVPLQPAHVECSLQIGDWHPPEGFIELWRCLTILGNEILDFSYWTELTISLPNLEISYDRFAFSILPLDAHRTLQRLTWSGHSAQLINSWLPLTPPLLQSLQMLTLTCDISLQDSSYILYHGTQLKSLIIRTIRPTSFIDSVFPHLESSSRNPRTCLEELDLTSRADISSLLAQFEFPSLRILRIKLWYPTCRSGVQDAENFDWKKLKQVELSADLSTEDQDRIRSRCYPTTQIQFRDHLWVFPAWYFSF